MPNIDRINSIYDVEALEKEQARVLEGLGASRKAIADLYNQIQNFKGTGFATISTDTQKLADATIKATAATTQAVEAAKNLSNTYKSVSGSLEQNIKLQLQYKNEVDALKKEQKELADSFKATSDGAAIFGARQVEITQRLEELKQASGELQRTIRLQVKEQQAAGGSVDELKAQYDRLFQVFRGLSDEERNASFGQQLNKDLEGLSNKINEIQKSAGNFSSNVGRYTGSFKAAFGTLEQELINIRNQLAGLNKGDAGFEQLQQQEQLLTQLTEGLTKEFGNQTQEIRALQRAAETLGLELGNQSELFLQFKDKVGEGVDALGDIRAQIKQAASDTRTLDGLIGIAQGLAGAFGLAQGAAALLGDDSEDLQKQFVKLQAVMTVLNSLQEIQNALQAESAAMMAIQTARANALAISQRFLGLAFGEAAAGSKALTAALATTGILALVAAIGAVLYKLYEYTTSTKNAAEAQKDLYAAIDETNKAVLAQNDLLAESQQQGIKLLQNRIALEEKSGASQVRLAELQKALAKQQGDNAAAQLQNLGLTESKIERLGGKYFSLNEDLQAINQSITQATKDNDTDLLESLKKVKEAKEQEIATVGNVYKKGVDLLGQLTDSQQKYAEITTDTEYKLTEARRKGLSDRRKLILDDIATTNEAIAGNEGFGEQQRIRSAREALNARLGLIEEERKRSLDNVNLTNEERNAIETKAGIERKNAIYKTENDIAKIRIDIKKKSDEEYKAAYDAVNAINPDTTNEAILRQTKARIDDELEIYRKGADDRQVIIATKYINEQTALEDARNKGTISEKKYQDELFKIQQEASKKSLEAIVSDSEKQLQVLVAGGQIGTSEYDKLVNTIATAKKGIADLGRGDQLKGLEDLKKTIGEIGSLSDQVFGVIGDALKIGFTKRKNQIQDLENAQQQSYEAEVERINNSTLSEEQKSATLIKLEATRNAQKQKNDREQKKVDIEKAKFDKAANIAKIITATALAVVEALPNIFLAAAVGAIGAAQLAIAIATPLPTYAKGTQSSKGGWALTDEKGAEMYIEPSGKTYMGSDNGPVLRNLVAGTRIIPADQVNEAMRNQMIKLTAAKLQEKENKSEQYLKQLVENSKKKNKTIINIPKNNAGWEWYKYKQIYE